MPILDSANEVVRIVGLIIEYIGLAIVVVSVVLALSKVVLPSYSMESIRRRLAMHIIFGLEFVIAADILLATVATDFQDILHLGGIVVIRVVLGYSLRKEAHF
ncbi:MAG: hypothetical protein COU35_00445 [Candidatus Magasanikbacteria bacterium CG10_big_fil_rev_8_21_14_0_10_47_10]|uniref:DUF1622 domain-containing protein n=1 Tax=Candidatus Magasanikbacteria bacterium CG10_big_fil_rev_8_21_14_0_10_47_10 TaxID=1974652 RepID=A0A2H0TRP7_9BACT|nr:MAG: hypothetical protein COU35_00445 [Candidatus Magasanikbacteria bacterium CG10_big_fil_rev_8_21_14_0_10_47_10]